MKDLWQDIDKIISLLKNDRPKLLILDFDGTLAPIANTPGEARLPNKTKDILQKLSEKQGFYMSVISGRKLADIKRKIRIPNIIYGGSHGLEGEIFKKKFLHPAGNKASGTLKSLRSKLQQIALKYKGVLIEDKKIALGFHFRMAEKGKAREIKSMFDHTVKNFLDNKAITLIYGKEEIDLLPEADWNKGSYAHLVIEEILSRTKLHPIVIVIGDDATDENIFQDPKNDVTVVVGKKPGSKAKYYLENPEDVFRFLKLLYAEVFQNNYFSKLRQIGRIVEKKDFDNNEFLQFWKGLVRDSSGRWLNYYKKGIKYFKYGKQVKPDINDSLQLAFIRSSIEHEEAFLNGLYDQSFRNLKQWLIKLHQKQSYFGTTGQILSERRVSEGEHTQIVIESIPALAKKYSDPYINKGTQVVYLPGINMRSCPIDRWKNGQVYHYYADPKYFDQYLHVMKDMLQEFISLKNRKSDKKTIKMIANYYQYGINMHMFETVNQSLFANQANAMLKLLGLKPVEHGIMDFVAMRFQAENFADYFFDEVKSFQV